MERYDVDEDGCRYTHHNGDYVLWEDAQKRIAELERQVKGQFVSVALLEQAERERDEAVSLRQLYHSERQELRTILRVTMPQTDGTHTAEYDPQPELVDAARQIVRELDEARGRVRALELAIQMAVSR